MTLVELYAERDRLRDRRKYLEGELEKLEQPRTANALAINEILKNRPENRLSGGGGCLPLQQTTLEDLPEFVNPPWVDY